MAYFKLERSYWSYSARAHSRRYWVGIWPKTVTLCFWMASRVSLGSKMRSRRWCRRCKSGHQLFGDATHVAGREVDQHYHLLAGLLNAAIEHLVLMMMFRGTLPPVWVPVVPVVKMIRAGCGCLLEHRLSQAAVKIFSA